MTVADGVFQLVSELRHSGIPISVAETEDAMCALMQIPIERRPVFRSALATALVKEPQARRTFDRFFDIVFPPGSNGQTSGSPDNDLLEELTVAERLSRAVKEMDEQAMREIAQQLVDEEADVDPNARVSDEHYEYRALRGLDLQDLIKRLVEEDVSGKGRSALGRRLLEEDFQDRMDRFGQEVAEAIRSQR
ncbi:MAG: hypothetical protein H0U53_00725, partial [Actinobacteria bacterium]|nr:hypothetical protein [Actinomycetota bacterium]